MDNFCSSCGAKLNENAKFCHVCGVAVGAGPKATAAAPNMYFWAPVGLSLLAVIALVAFQLGSPPPAPTAGGDALRSPVRAPDISQMTPQEQADRLFDRVMRYASEGKSDSAAFFAPMAMGAIEAIGPLDNHRRYDIGLIALVSGDVPAARAQSDTILKSHPTHLLGLILAAKAAIARGDNATAASMWQRLIAAEPKERESGLPEYTGHGNDLMEGLELARKR